MSKTSPRSRQPVDAPDELDVVRAPGRVRAHPGLVPAHRLVRRRVVEADRQRHLAVAEPHARRVGQPRARPPRRTRRAPGDGRTGSGRSRAAGTVPPRRSRRPRRGRRAAPWRAGGSAAGRPGPGRRAGLDEQVVVAGPAGDQGRPRTRRRHVDQRRDPVPRRCSGRAAMPGLPVGWPAAAASSQDRRVRAGPARPAPGSPAAAGPGRRDGTGPSIQRSARDHHGGDHEAAEARAVRPDDDRGVAGDHDRRRRGRRCRGCCDGCRPASPPSVARPRGRRPEQPDAGAVGAVVDRHSAANSAGAPALGEVVGRAVRPGHDPQRPLVAQLGQQRGQRRRAVGSSPAAPSGSSSPPRSARPACPPKPPSRNVARLPSTGGTASPPRDREVRRAGPDARSAPRSSTAPGSTGDRARRADRLPVERSPRAPRRPRRSVAASR